MVLAYETLPECGGIGVGDFESAHVEVSQRRVASNQVQRSSAFGSRFGKRESTATKIKQCEADARRSLVHGVEPAQPPRDHQMDDQEQFLFECDNDALAQAPHFLHTFALRFDDGWYCAAQHEWIDQPDALKRLTDDAPL